MPQIILHSPLARKRTLSTFEILHDTRLVALTRVSTVLNMRLLLCIKIFVRGRNRRISLSGVAPCFLHAMREIRGKIILQELCRANLGWDAPIPET